MLLYSVSQERGKHQSLGLETESSGPPGFFSFRCTCGHLASTVSSTATVPRKNLDQKPAVESAAHAHPEESINSCLVTLKTAPPLLWAGHGGSLDVRLSSGNGRNVLVGMKRARGGLATEHHEQGREVDRDLLRDGDIGKRATST